MIKCKTSPIPEGEHKTSERGSPRCRSTTSCHLPRRGTSTPTRSMTEYPLSLMMVLCWPVASWYYSWKPSFSERGVPYDFIWTWYSESKTPSPRFTAVLFATLVNLSPLFLRAFFIFYTFAVERKTYRPWQQFKRYILHSSSYYGAQLLQLSTLKASVTTYCRKVQGQPV